MIMSDLPESTQTYIQEKVDHIYYEFTKKVNSNLEDYQAYINTPYAKSMLRFRFQFELENENLTENEIFDMAIDEGLSSLIYSAITKLIPKESVDLYLCNHLVISSINEIKDYLDYVSTLTFKTDMESQLQSIKYLFFGEKHIPFISALLKVEIKDGFNGVYKGIKFFYIEKIEDIFISNAAFIDLNTIDVRYNEMIKEEYIDIFDQDALYETIPKYMKNSVLTFNCLLGDINLIKLESHFGEGKQFYRKLKLSRILKNEIGI